MNDSGFNNVLKESPPFWGYHTIEMVDCPVYSANYKKFYKTIIKKTFSLGDEEFTII